MRFLTLTVCISGLLAMSTVVMADEAAAEGTEAQEREVYDPDEYEERDAREGREGDRDGDCRHHKCDYRDDEKGDCRSSEGECSLCDDGCGTTVIRAPHVEGCVPRLCPRGQNLLCSECVVPLGGQCNQNTGRCAPGLQCVDGICVGLCIANFDCPENTPVCDINSGKCITCRSNLDCPPQDPTCATTGNTQGQCFACTSDTDCATNAPDTPLCQSNGLCVECLNNASCPASNPVCVDGTCRPCKSNVDCEGSSFGPTCATIGNTQGQCFICTSDTDCAVNAPGTPLCDTDGSVTGTTGLCYICTSNNNCPLDNRACVDGICVPCRSNADCPTDNPLCTNGKCGPCTSNADCPIAHPNCALVGGNPGQCFACSSSISCEENTPSTPHCDTTSKLCVQCLSDFDCPSGETCVSGTCQPSNTDPSILVGEL